MRKPRIIQQGATYHVVAKTNRGEFILNSDEVKEMFLKTLEQAKKRFSFKLLNFCIMSNHIHLLLEPAPGTSLSKLMQWILAVFAVRFNRRYGLTGHVWYDRFKSSIIRTFPHFIHAFQYISNNPVKAGICTDAYNYAYSGLHELKKKRLRLLEAPDDLRHLMLQIVPAD